MTAVLQDVLQDVFLLLTVLGTAGVAVSAIVLAIVPVCLMRDRWRRRREAAERLVLLRATQPAAPEQFAAGCARLDAALDTTDPDDIAADHTQER